MDDVSYDENFVVNSDASVCQPIVEKTIEAIRERLLSRYIILPFLKVAYSQKVF